MLRVFSTIVIHSCQVPIAYVFVVIRLVSTVGECGVINIPKRHAKRMTSYDKTDTTHIVLRVVVVIQLVMSVVVADIHAIGIVFGINAIFTNDKVKTLSRLVNVIVNLVEQ